MKPKGEQASSWSCWLLVIIFAIGMAYVESAAVFYLRAPGERIDPYRRQPLAPALDFGHTEVGREAATMVMLAAVGWLAGCGARARLGHFLAAFGTWDIFYYVFLRVLTGWPHSLLDWDVLFLIPLPWWGPVLAPVCIALLMVAYGTLLSQYQRPARSSRAEWKAWAPGLAGTGLALYVFMADAISVLGQGPAALRELLPVRFNWPLFGAAWLLMSAPVLAEAWRLWMQPRRTALPQPEEA